MALMIRPTGSRFGGDGLAAPALLEAELRLLATIRYHGHLIHGGDMTERDLLVAESLERFRLLDHAHVYDDGRWTDWAWVVSDAGAEFLDRFRPRWDGCRCEHAIRLPCVCSERTFCPNPDHTGNGCHGTHD